jgi:hypothetical protein
VAFEKCGIGNHLILISGHCFTFSIAGDQRECAHAMPPLSQTIQQVVWENRAPHDEAAAFTHRECPIAEPSSLPQIRVVKEIVDN